MKALRRLANRIGALRFRSNREKQLSEEIGFHIQMQTEENLRAGMPPEEARRAAVLQFGGMESVKERYREQQGLPFLENLIADLRYAVRGCKRSPGFTLTAVSMLALGIGATTAIFSIVNAALLKPLQLHEPDRLLLLLTGWKGDYGMVLSPLKFAHFRKQSAVLEYVSAFDFDGVVNYKGADSAEQWQSLQLSADGFNCLGIGVVQGRTYTAEEDLPNAPKVAVISQGLWAQRFGSDPGIIGRAVTLNEELYTVIGVVEDSEALKHDFGTSDFPQVYLPMQLDPNSHDEGNYFQALARLKPGVSLAQARARLKASGADFRASAPPNVSDADLMNLFNAMPLRNALVSDYRILFAILLSAVGFVLLIACANVANLLLARAAGRTREIAIRSAIGADRRRVIRQLMTESLLLSLAAGAVGAALGFRAIRAILTVDTFDIPLLGDNGSGVYIDWRVMAFALLVSALTAVVFGLFPALRASRADINTILKNSGPRSGGGIRQNKARSMLVVSEISLAVLLLVGSALLIRSFIGLYRADRGFDPQNVLAVDTILSGPKYRTAAGTGETVNAGLEQIRATPGVVEAGATGCMLLECELFYSFDVNGRPPGNRDEQSAGWATITPGFFEALKIQMKRGRAFSSHDDDKAANAVIINETMAKTFWKDGDPLRSRIMIHRQPGSPTEPERQIIGIVADVRGNLFSQKPLPMMYVPAAQFPSDKTWLNTHLTWVVRTHTAPLNFASTIRENLRRATGLPAGKTQSMRDLVASSISENQLMTFLMTLFGLSALLLAAVGIYGVMASIVQQRTPEIGIRMALGAHATEVRNMVVREGAIVTVAGIVIGVAASWVLARPMESLLFGVRAHDPIVFVTVPLFLGTVALFSVWIPANRASRVNPVESLRCE